MTKPISVLLIFLFACLANNATGQMKINLQVKQPSCIRSIGHNYLGEGDGSILATISNGVPPYTFYISNISYNYTFPQQNNGYFPNLFDGYYTLQVTDAIGQFSITNTLLSSKYTWPNLLVNSTAPTSCISHDGSISLSGTMGTPPFRYSIDGANTFSTNGSFTNLSQGIYVLYVQDANGCINRNYVSPVQTSSIAPSYAISCFQCCDLDFAAGSGTITAGLTSCKNEGYAWVFKSYLVAPDRLSARYDSAVKFSNDGINYHNANNKYQIDTVGNLAPGQYTYYAKDTNTNKTSLWTYIIGKSCDVYVDFIQVSASCGLSDGQLQVNAKNGASPYTYSMDGTNFQVSNVFTGLSTGNYSVSVKDANGVTTSSIATVYNKCPIVLATHKNAGCNINNGSIQAHGYLGTRPYQFSINNINFKTDSLFTGIGKGIYTVYIKDVKGYIDSFTNIQITDSCLNATATVINEYCNQKNGSITATGSQGTPPYQFSIDGINFQPNTFFPNLSFGTYVLTIKDASNITDTIHIVVGNVTYSVNLGNDTTLCSGQSLNLNPGLLNATYVWQDGSTSNNFTVSKPGKYWVTATTSTKCVVSDTINISYLNIGSVFTTHDTIACIGNNILLDAKHPGSSVLWDDGSISQTRNVNTDGKYWVNLSSGGCTTSDTIICHFVSPPIVVFPSDTSFCASQQLILNAGNINATYLWNTGSVGSTLTVTRAGTYIVAATANGCTTYDTIKVTVKLNPQIFLGNDTTLCVGQTLHLNATAANTTYFWQDGSNAPTFTVTKPGSYWVIATKDGCDTTAGIKVVYTTKAVVNLRADTTLCNGNKLVLDATYPQSSYLWQDGSINPKYTVTVAGNYVVNVTNYCGTVTDSIAVQFENCDCQFYIPSAFTPNGDGKNDVFKPTYKCFYNSFRIDIFSRFGKIIFTSTNPDNGWDGMVNGFQQPTGVYIWEMYYQDVITGKNVKKKGTVVLVR